jgi:hypothetical protein
MRMECPAGPLMATVDPYQIDRVVINLLSNAASARRHGPPPP